MMRLTPDAGQSASDATALIFTGTLAVILLSTARNLRLDMPERPPASNPSIELSVESAPTEMPRTPPAPTPQQVPRKAISHHVMPRVEAAAPTAVPVDPPPAFVQEAPVDDSSVAAPAAADPTPANSHPDVDAQYAAGLRADIDRRTHPPDTAQYRLHHPSGEARVRFVVVRTGEPKAVALLRSSGSPLLDEAALQIVSSGHYAPMPANAFSGEADHTFVVSIEFRPGSVAL